MIPRYPFDFFIVIKKIFNTNLRNTKVSILEYIFSDWPARAEQSGRFSPTAMVCKSLIIGVFVSLITISCSSPSPTIMTQRLFMQTKRPNIQLPNKANSDENGASIVSEKVTFRDSSYGVTDGEVAFKEGQNKLDTNAVYRLSEVEINAQGRFTAERDGRINVDFKITVPKEILSNDWRLVLNPKLMHNDSVVPLQKVVLSGQGFVDKQKQDYADYDKYMKSIVDKSQYDSVYLDKANISKDIRARQTYYYGIYQKDFKEQMDYEKWKYKRAVEDAYEDAKKTKYRTEQYHAYARKIMEHKVRNVVEKKDTTGLHAKYMKEYEHKTRKYIGRYLDDFNNPGGKDSVQWLKEMELRAIPKKYRAIHEEKRGLGDVTNHIFTLNDSVEIAKHRYFFDQIVLNEVSAARSDDMFKYLVKFPYDENKAEIRLDTIISSDNNFVFYYTQEYPVAQGLKTVRIAMDSKVQAIDQSEYTFQKADTLSFFIASLAQLVDTSLITKRTELYRNLYDRMTVYTKYKTTKTQMSIYDANYQGNKEQMDRFVEAFRTYNNSPEFVIDSVSMISTTSLEGDYDDNYELTLKRAASVRNYLSQTLSGEANVENLFKINHRGEDWNALLVHIRKRNDIENLSEIQNMLTNAVYPDQCETDIAKQFPADYKIIQDSVYPLLRKVDFIIDMHRTGLDADTVKVEYRSDYEEGLRLLQDRKYWEAIDILANYPDYNAALCLTCMGYNNKAYDLLIQQPSSGNVEYLLAILSSRLQKEDEAVSHLLKAFELDPTKVYRAKLDPEVSALVSKYNLEPQLD